MGNTVSDFDQTKSIAIVVFLLVTVGGTVIVGLLYRAWKHRVARDWWKSHFGKED